ncbi:hypothetical protein [Kitasatospora sp. NPDC057500]|uniref:hypothetical protein n=1 Tax=Kitasatospora sp. NPDC057500 TaxID=3346151 RepID=UPI0036BFFF14
MPGPALRLVGEHPGEGGRQWGTVAAGKADLDDLVTARALVKEHLTAHGDVRPLRDLVVGGTVSASDLTVGGKLTTSGEYALTVHGASVFEGKVNANKHLSVRSEGVGWILHTGDEKVAIQADLRVHGQLHADS